ncbi:PIN domain-like protein [Fennellomyces sp. T-0311]|nr:PIN domain-like protein [Fennellomyces sp. T-0311]
MGIFGLSAFVHEHGTLGDQCSWSSDAKEKADQHFIIDGNAFTYHYAMKNNTSWIHGGQYRAVAEVIRHDIAALQRAGIQITFLFDGALPDDKEHTRMKRYRSYIERAELLLTHLDQINQGFKGKDGGIAADMYLIPPLMLDVCIQTIRDLGLDPVVCQGEADGHVVRLAEERQGYVISKDSDMHVYPKIGKGYIPLNTLSITNTEDSCLVKATVYHPQRLASLLQLDTNILPVFGAILGNDYLDPQLVRYPIMDWCSSHSMTVKNKISFWPKCVAEFLRSMDKQDLSGIADQLKTVIKESRGNTSVDGLEQALIASVHRYDPDSTLLGQKQEESKEEVSESGKMSRSIVDILATRTFWATLFIEDFQKESSWILCRQLRQCLYTLLLGDNGSTPQVRECIREKHHMEEIMVDGLSVEELGAPIEQIFNDKEAAWKLLRDLHFSQDIGEYLADLGDELQSFVFCMRFLICRSGQQGTQLKNHEVVGMIVGAMASLTSTDKWPEHNNAKPALKKQMLHLTAQYQNIVYCSHLLGQVLGIQHLQGKGMLERMYDGISMHQYLQLSRRGFNVGSLLGNAAHDLSGTFWKLYRATTSGLLFYIDDFYDYRIPLHIPTETDWLTPRNIKKRTNNGSNNKSAKRAATSNNTSNTKQAGKNIFDVLSFGCNFEDE